MAPVLIAIAANRTMTPTMIEMVDEKEKRDDHTNINFILLAIVIITLFVLYVKTGGI